MYKDNGENEKKNVEEEEEEKERKKVKPVQSVSPFISDRAMRYSFPPFSLYLICLFVA